MKAVAVLSMFYCNQLWFMYYTIHKATDECDIGRIITFSHQHCKRAERRVHVDSASVHIIHITPYKKPFKSLVRFPYKNCSQLAIIELKPDGESSAIMKVLYEVSSKEILNLVHYSVKCLSAYGTKLLRL